MKDSDFGQISNRFLAIVSRRYCRIQANSLYISDPYNRWGDPYSQPCHHYVTLSQPERRVSNTIDHLTDSALCDRALKRRWYRSVPPGASCMRGWDKLVSTSATPFSL